MTQTFYDVLGVPPDASTDRIRAAYRERLKESHPDLNDEEDANETTRRIIRARDVLTDEGERERYDDVGHAAYVGDDDSPVDEDDVSDAATAARQAGWGDDASNGSSRSASGDRETHDRRSGAEKRRRARDRRRRERAARERVDREADRSSGAKTQGTATTDGGSTAASTGSPGNVAGADRSWNGSSGFSVRQRHQTSHRRRLVPSGKSLTLLAVSLFLYPLMLFSALFPPFPLVVNVVVGFCTIFLVGYLQSRPGVGVAVFGTWSLLTPVAFVTAGVPLTGLVGIAGLTGTWLPFGLSVATLVLVRP